RASLAPFGKNAVESVVSQVIAAQIYIDNIIRIEDNQFFCCRHNPLQRLQTYLTRLFSRFVLSYFSVIAPSFLNDARAAEVCGARAILTLLNQRAYITFGAPAIMRRHRRPDN